MSRGPEQRITNIIKPVLENSRAPKIVDPVVPSFAFAFALGAFQIFHILVAPGADAKRILVDQLHVHEHLANTPHDPSMFYKRGH